MVSQADDEKDKAERFTRQRRNLMLISLVWIFTEIAGVKPLDKIIVLGTTIDLARPVSLSYVILAFWLYWLYRYYIHLRAIGISSTFTEEWEGTTRHYLIRYHAAAFDRSYEVREYLEKFGNDFSPEIPAYIDCIPVFAGIRGTYQFSGGRLPNAQPGIATKILLHEMLIARARGLLLWIFLMRSFSEYYFPYFLALIPAYIFVVRHLIL